MLHASATDQVPRHTFVSRLRTELEKQFIIFSLTRERVQPIEICTKENMICKEHLVQSARLTVGKSQRYVFPVRLG